jgi:cysteine desulfurase
MRRVYLDYASTAPLRAVAREAMLPWLGGARNPSSVHYEGRQARQALDRARDRFAAILRVRSREIVFTASGSESISLALLGVMAALGPRGCLFTTAVEHQAVLASAARMVEVGWEHVVLGVDDAGRLDLAELEAALLAGDARWPRLVSAMLVNNELGTINDLTAISAIAHEHEALLHCDAIGAGALLAFSELPAQVDLLSLAAHKFGGPLGAGILWARASAPILPLLHGGGQEHGKRAGTENLAAIVGAAAALEEAEGERATAAARVEALRGSFEERVCSALPEVKVLARAAPRAPSIANLAIPGIPFDVLPTALDLAGVAASTGSACASGALKRSHVLEALGVRDGAAMRFSWGSGSTEEESAFAAERLVAAVKQARAEWGEKGCA